MIPTVWSEREHDPNHPGWHDCTYSGGLMCLRAGGFDKFPLGVNTNAEREALESSDDRTDETGAAPSDLDTAIKRRYGLSLHHLTSGTLREALSKPGYAFVLFGFNGNLPTGHHLRRFDPTFTGGHCVCVITKGNGKVLWLDPEAPMGYAGEEVDIDTVLTWAWDAIKWPRYLKLGELAPKPVKRDHFGGSDFAHIVNRRATFGVLSNFRDAPTTDGSAIIMQVKAGESFFPVASVHWQRLGDEPDGDLWYFGWLYDDSPTGYTPGWCHSSCLKHDGDAVALAPVEQVADADLTGQIADLTKKLAAAQQAQSAAEAAQKKAEAAEAAAKAETARLSGPVGAFVKALNELQKAA